jgi:hypothetical protein
VKSKSVPLKAYSDFTMWALAISSCGRVLLSIGLISVFMAVAENAHAAGPAYHTETRTEPRPLSMHVLKIDLTDPSLELAVAMSADPDVGGPAEARLVDPISLANDAGLIAAVNANAWRNLADGPDREVPTEYLENGYCDILGWVKAKEGMRSLVEPAFWAFWIDANGVPHIGSLHKPVEARLAIAGFGGLLEGGQTLPKDGGPLHPRTAIGLDSEKRELTLLVVDGRQPGVSEGVTETELAKLMAELGCSDALNLDGGGSSILLKMGSSGQLEIMNTPSGETGPRPVPVMIGIR